MYGEHLCEVHTLVSGLDWSPRQLVVSVWLAVSERGLAGGLLMSGQVAVGESRQGHVTAVTETTAKHRRMTFITYVIY